MAGSGQGTDPDAGHAEGPVLDAVVGTWGPVEIRAIDVLVAAELRALDQGMTVETLLGPDWRSNPETARRAARIALEQALLRQEAERLGLHVDPAALETELASLDGPAARALAAVQSGEAESASTHLAPWPHLDVATLRANAEESVLYRQWLERAATGLDPATIRSLWDQDRYRVTVEVVLIPNLPPRSAIDDAVASRDAEIEAWYDEHRGYHTVPPRADIRLVRRHVPPNAPDRWWDEARAEMNSLRDLALEIGVHVVARQYSDDESRAEEGLTTVTHSAMPALFAVDVGEVSPVLQDRFGLYFAEVLAVHPPEQRPLDDTLRREIAATLLRQEVAWPEAVAAADDVIAAFAADDADALQRAVADHGLQRSVPPPFPRSRVGVVPGVGAAQDLHDAIFAETLGPGDYTTEPVRTPNGLVVARVVDRRRGTDDQWEAERDAFTERIEGEIRERAWSSRLQSWDLEHAVEIDVDAVMDAIAGAAVGEPPPGAPSSGDGDNNGDDEGSGAATP